MSDASSMLTLVRTDNGKSFTLRRGQSFEIRLPENPITGFRWSLDPLAIDVLALNQSSFAASDASRPVGASGERVFRFTTLATGIAQLQFKLWQEWEGESAATERFSATIQVES